MFKNKIFIVINRKPTKTYVVAGSIILMMRFGFFGLISLKYTRSDTYLTKTEPIPIK